MVFRVELTKSAEVDLEELYLWLTERAPSQGAAWFNGLEKAIDSPESLDPERPARVLRYGRARHVYRIHFWIDHAERAVYVLHVRHGARQNATSQGW